MTDSELHLLNRMLSKIHIGEEDGCCWLWTCRKQLKGYGTIKHDKKYKSAHRTMYMLLHGPIPAGKEIDHLCRVRHCVNPNHMEPVTHHVNVLRGDAGKYCKEKTHCKKGHLFDEANTQFRPDGARSCRICRNDKCVRFRMKSPELARKRCRDNYHKHKDRYRENRAKKALEIQERVTTAMSTGEVTFERIYHAANEQANVIAAARDKTCTREIMASFYEDAIIADTLAKRQGLPGVDFKAVNAAVVTRWPKGLNWIKERAWKKLEEHRKATQP